MDRREAISGLGVLIGGSLLGAPLPASANDHLKEEGFAANPSVRKKKILSDNWKFQVDIKNIGEEERWFGQSYAKSDWATVIVPKAWDCYEEGLWEYEGIAWYMTVINPGDFMSDKRTEILFNRVMYYSKVWVNGEYIGENVGGYLPFAFNISRFLKTGHANTVTIRVDNKPRVEWLPAAIDIEWIQYGGIIEKVELTGMEPVYIEDLAITSAFSGKNATASCLVNIVNETSAASEMDVLVEITKGAAAFKMTMPVTIAEGASRKVKIDIGIPNAQLWSPESPSLYLASAKLMRRGTVVDEVTDRFGIREVKTDGQRILLNGKAILIKGVNRYDDYGKLGPHVPEKLLREELALMKSVGINFIRVHYPQSSDLISLYDEFGFMMMEEVPMCWWGRKTEQTMDILQQAKPALTKMIRRDKNHPCLIIWSMSNECVTDSQVGIAVMRDLLVQAKELDPTRLVTYVIDGNDDPVKHLALDKADIICINKYYGVLHEKICRHIGDIEELGYKPFVAKMKQHRHDLPDKPMMVAEYGAQGIKTIRGDLYYSEDFQAAYIERIWEGIQDTGGLSGGVLWCWADYYHRKYFIGYAAFGPYGVVTTERKPKKSLDSLTRMYKGSRAIKK